MNTANEGRTNHARAWYQEHLFPMSISAADTRSRWDCPFRCQRLFLRNGQQFIITNWHVVSGRHFLTRQPLAHPFTEPFSLVAKLSSYAVGDRERDTFGIHCAPYHSIAENSQCGLNKRSSVHYGMWLPYPWQDLLHVQISCTMRQNRISKDNIPVQPGSNVFAIGFPHALSVGFGLPLCQPVKSISSATRNSAGSLQPCKPLPSCFMRQTHHGSV